MKIAVISDIHENIHNLIQATKMIKQEKCEVIFCLGDVGRSKLFEVLFTLKLPLYFTFWNHDWNVIKDVKMLIKNNWEVRSNWFYQRIELEGRKIFLTHYDDLARDIAKSGEYDACFWGHLHMKFEEFYGNTLCVNPWEITGTREHNPSWYLYDTRTNAWEFRYIANHHEMHTQEVEKFLHEMKTNF